MSESTPPVRTNPCLLFEVSWEVCNMVGGIHTVLATKADTMRNLYDDDYIVLGPWLPHGNLDAFKEEPLYPELREAMAAKGITVHIGRWDVPGSPVCFLVDFSRAYKNKDDILEWMWAQYGVDSLPGGWDYIEPVLFGYTCGRVIQEFVESRQVAPQYHVVAQWHEWMVGSGLLYLKKEAPEVASVFTTHATVLGRSISGSGASLRDALKKIDAADHARALGIAAKASLESTLAREADCFTTVSRTTAKEARAFLGRDPDVLLLNAIGERFPDPSLTEPKQRSRTRATLLRLATAVTGVSYSDDAVLAITSGRYEFINKGLDLVIESLGQLRERASGARPPLICFFCTPSDSTGPVPEVEAAFRDGTAGVGGVATHTVRSPEQDPTLRDLAARGIANDPGDDVHAIFVPIYLDGTDSMIPGSYYELLAAFDLSIFPSHYEPWGYTPLESIGYGIPTVTSDLAGFGQWAASLDTRDRAAAYVLPREETPFAESAQLLTDHLDRFLALDRSSREQLGEEALRLSRLARWEHFGAYYRRAHEVAIEARYVRYHPGMPEYQERARTSRAAGERLELLVGDRAQPHMMSFTVHNRVPAELDRLRELARNVWWSWNPEAESLFRDLDAERWRLCGHNPVQLLDDVPQAALDERARDDAFLQRMRGVLEQFDRYLDERRGDAVEIAYFCMEFGLHESLPLYSGGLGVLAGDHLKAASDAGLPLAAVGLAYRAGYFRQRFDSDGRQISDRRIYNPRTLPMHRVRDAAGEPVVISLYFPGREVFLGAWRVDVGSVPLYLLDSDRDENTAEDRRLTEQLYSGDQEWRLQQELILGVGGRVLLDTLGIKPYVHHMNEGHAAFLVLSRAYELVKRSALDFATAFELVRRTSVFTTHTPVAAGHDAFPEDMVRPYFSPYERGLQASWDQIMALGHNAGEGSDAPFSMTSLGLRGASRVNGVSKIHAGVSQENLSPVAPGFHSSELPIKAITNGVHVRTWLGAELQALLDSELAETTRGLPYSPDALASLSQISGDKIRTAKFEQKRQLLDEVRRRVEELHHERGESPSQLRATLDGLDENSLIIGFARRFAPYKRSTLLFSDLEALARIVEEPVVFLFAGKAHPSDGAGQELIRQIFEISRRPEFLGKIVLLENYDMGLARKLVGGCDVWLNTPTPPLEASGTSGMKAAMNGALNLSIADGWWDEGFNGSNGWVIGGRTFDSADRQNEFDSHHLYQLLKEEVIPAYFDGGQPMSAKWIEMTRSAMVSTLYDFSAARMLAQYQEEFYTPSHEEGESLAANDFQSAKQRAQAKQNVRSCWKDLRIAEVRMSGLEEDLIHAGDPVTVWVTVEHPGLDAGDLRVELVIGEPNSEGWEAGRAIPLTVETSQPTGTQLTGTYVPERSGERGYGIRVVPAIADSTDLDLELALAKWA